MSDPKLMIGTPIAGDIPVSFMQAFVRLHQHQPCPFTSMQVCGGSVRQSRNFITAEFMAREDHTHLLMLDSDVLPYPEMVTRLLNHDVDIVGGIYPRKVAGPVQWPVVPFENDGHIGATGLQAVARIAAGFLLIKRGVLEAMREAFYQAICYWCEDRKRIEHDFWPEGHYRRLADFPPEQAQKPFDCRPETLSRDVPIFLSEDFYFCERARELGFNVWADMRMVLSHVEGIVSFPYPGQIEAKYNEPLTQPA